MSEIAFHTAAHGGNIAYRLTDGAGPAYVFLPGYLSDMAGGKATAVFDWAASQDRACLLFDYSGCGESEGEFANGTLSKWRDEALELIETTLPHKDIVLIGSSMGGWLMLMIGLALKERLAGVVGIASAPDFTDWGRDLEDKAKLENGETVFDENPYGPEPTPMHPGFFKDGQANLLLYGAIGITCPVRLLHGQRDADVPWEISLRLADALDAEDVQTLLIKDGDHRLSRDSDIALLLRTVAEFA